MLCGDWIASIKFSLPVRLPVYVHCKIGYSRSAAAVGAYLLASGQAVTVTDVVAYLQQVRPSIIVRPEVWDVLQTFAQTAKLNL